MPILRAVPDLWWPAALISALVALLAAIDPVLHYGRVISSHDPWSQWPLTPGITLPTLAVLWLYIAGQRTSPVLPNQPSGAFRHLAFFGGVAAVFLALQSPIEEISDHIFIVHQVEHMLLRTVGPMLLMLAMPQAALVRGLPNWVRRRVLTPLLVSRPVRVLGVFGHPAVATILFIGTTYFWMIPRFHDLAILNEPVHYLWHTTLLLSGLIFFWRIFDPRPYPIGASIPLRIFMFGLATIGNIVLGSYLSFKHQVLYSAYGDMGRLWAIRPATDERFGGLTMWIPGSMMFAAAAMLMVYRQARQEDRTAARSRIDGRIAAKSTGSLTQPRPANCRLAMGLLGGAVTILVITFVTAMIYHFSTRHP
ncbi:MAG: cytochrome c oxidase assembly protein, partial [Alphaproteobacteria bacterium]|nr:cytochrome c oxidase assembly protein [Alphaproteobacteria bacterium]